MKAQARATTRSAHTGTGILAIALFGLLFFGASGFPSPYLGFSLLARSISAVLPAPSPFGNLDARRGCVGRSHRRAAMSSLFVLEPGRGGVVDPRHTGSSSVSAVELVTSSGWRL